MTHGFFVASVYGQQKRDEQVARAVLGLPRILRGACGGGRGERQEGQADQEGGDQVRSGTTDKVPAGYADAVAEYWRKLGKGK